MKSYNLVLEVDGETCDLAGFVNSNVGKYKKVRRGAPIQPEEDDLVAAGVLATLKAHQDMRPGTTLEGFKKYASTMIRHALQAEYRVVDPAACRKGPAVEMVHIDERKEDSLGFLDTHVPAMPAGTEVSSRVLESYRVLEDEVSKALGEGGLTILREAYLQGRMAAPDACRSVGVPIRTWQANWRRVRCAVGKRLGYAVRNPNAPGLHSNWARQRRERGPSVLPARLSRCAGGSTAAQCAVV